MGLFQSIAGAFGGFFEKRLWSTAGGGRKTTAQETVSEYSALNYSPVWCATKLLCGTSASLPLPLYRGRDSESREKDRDHPVYKLLNGQPNSEMTAYNFRSLMWQWQVNWGNAYAEIVREGNDSEGELLALWPLHPERVTPRRSATGDLEYEVKGEHLGDKDVVLASWQMLHIPSIITSDGIIGHGVIAHARESIGAGVAAEKYGANWFGGAAVPRIVIEHDKQWNDDVRNAFRREWDEIHSGPDGHRVAVLQGGAKAKPISLSAEDSQFLETRQFGVEEIARWYGVPPFLLQYLLNATLNNVEHLGISFVQYSLIPWLRIWEQCIWKQLLTPSEQSEYFVEHNVDALMRGDHAARSEFYRSMTGAALMTRNECRRLENLDPVEGGDTFLVQGAMVPLDQDGRPESQFTSQNGGSPPAPIEPNTGKKAIQAVETRLERIIQHDLARFLTKETKAMANFAKKPDQFLSLVEDFYVEHFSIVRDELNETIGALEECGSKISVDVVVTAWINEGKVAVIDASGTAMPEKLPQIIQNAMESRVWTERPLRAVEGIRECKRSLATCG